MKKRLIGILLLVCSVVLMFFGFDFNITGNFVKNYFEGNFIFIHILGFVFLFVSVILLTSRKTLDAIIIPTGGETKEDIERASRAGKEKIKVKYFIISGGRGANPLPESERANIYRELRRHGIKPSQIKIEGKSSDTLENVIYSLKKFKDFKKIGIVSYPQHLNRFEYIINKAKEEGIINKDVEIEKIPTKQTAKQFIYGILGNVKERYRLRYGIRKAEEGGVGKFENFIKKLIS